MNERYLQNKIITDLSKKMVFIGGPRQVGKTSLAQLIGSSQYTHPVYFNWDQAQHRKSIIDMRFPGNAHLLIFDELHKYKQWKNYIKGVFDTQTQPTNILVTGSARLNIYRKGGDSLMGRYYYYRLHPFSLAEYTHTYVAQNIGQALNFPVTTPQQLAEYQQALAQLWKFGGFPEPLFEQNESTLRRWHNQRTEQLIKEDIRDIESIRDISGLEVLVQLLPDRVGSRLSLNSLREDLQVAHKTVTHWMDVLEQFYYHFRIPAFHHRAIQALKKERKLYLWDWSEVSNDAARFENIIASHLLKYAHYLYDTQGHKATVHYIRDKQGREVDFLIAVNNTPWFAVEVKLSDTAPSSHLQYYKEKLAIPYVYQVVRAPNIDVVEKDVRIISAETFLASLI